MKRLHLIARRLKSALLRERKGRSGRSSRAGVALLLTISIVALLTVVVTELSYSASVRIQMAANARDEAKAEALAHAGVQFYRLVLVASKQLEGQMEVINQQMQGMGMDLSSLGIGGTQLWQFVPTVSSSFVRMLIGSGSGDDAMLAALGDEAGGPNEVDADFERNPLKETFLQFDGDFTATVSDEDRMLGVGDMQANDAEGLQTNPNALRLAALMSGEDDLAYLRDINYEKWELIGNLVDWTDADDNQIYKGGRESGLYERLDSPYLPKNAPFDTLDEIRLVDGWHLEGVWERFGKHLSIYGGGKVNVNTASRPVLGALFRAYIQPVPTDYTLDLIFENLQLYRTGGDPSNPGSGSPFFFSEEQFVQWLQTAAPGTVDEQISGAITTKSNVFRVKSTGEVGKATVTIEVVYDFSSAATGKVLYWNIR